ncbi:topoisomerase C-terminal repeat-containing protein [Domibacillus sp. 8LH]|uniref:topoisomerase C-terminal repeat-containing protein n=2 Tax=Domibacillus TaxID=1433999 RepID=UPI003177D433
MTAKWEYYFRKIGEGSGSSGTFIQNIKKFVQNLIETIPEKMDGSTIQKAVQQQQAQSSCVCPVCKKGRMVDRKTLIGCSEYSNGCTFSIGKTIASKKLTEKNIKDLLEKGITPVIKGFKSSKAKKLRQRKTR